MRGRLGLQGGSGGHLGRLQELAGHGGRQRVRGLGADHLVQRVDEVAARPVRAQARAVERAAHFRLVLGVPLDAPQLRRPVRKL